jgi:hypothetical protein
MVSSLRGLKNRSKIHYGSRVMLVSVKPIKMDLPQKLRLCLHLKRHKYLIRSPGKIMDDKWMSDKDCVKVSSPRSKSLILYKYLSRACASNAPRRNIPSLR